MLVTKEGRCIFLYTGHRKGRYLPLYAGHRGGEGGTYLCMLDIYVGRNTPLNAGGRGGEVLTSVFWSQRWGETYLCMLVIGVGRTLPLNASYLRRRRYSFVYAGRREGKCLPVSICCLTVDKEVLDTHHLIVLYHIVTLWNIARLTLCCTRSVPALLVIR